MNFKEWLENQIKSISYKPGAVVPPVLFRNSGPEKMNPLQSVPPSKPYLPLFRSGKSQMKTTVANRKH